MGGVILLGIVDRLNGGQDSPVASVHTWPGNEVRSPTVEGVLVTVGRPEDGDVSQVL